MTGRIRSHVTGCAQRLILTRSALVCHVIMTGRKNSIPPVSDHSPELESDHFTPLPETRVKHRKRPALIWDAFDHPVTSSFNSIHFTLASKLPTTKCLTIVHVC